MKTEDLEAVSDGGLSEELEDVSEDEELECFKDSHFQIGPILMSFRPDTERP